MNCAATVSPDSAATALDACCPDKSGGFAASQGWLLAARAVQGAGGALVAPAALALIVRTFAEGPARSRAMGVYAAMSGGGAAAGMVARSQITAAAAAAARPARPGRPQARAPVYHHALAARITRRFSAASGIALAALVTTAVTTRTRRENLTSLAAAAPAQSASAQPASTPAPTPAPEGE